MKERQVVEVELACVRDVRGEQGERVCNHRRAKLDDERRVPRSRQTLGDPVLVPGKVREVRPERRVVQRDLTPAPAYMREVDRAEHWRASAGIRMLREGDEVEDTCKDLRREDRDLHEHVAARE